MLKTLAALLILPAFSFTNPDSKSFTKSLKGTTDTKSKSKVKVNATPTAATKMAVTKTLEQNKGDKVLTNNDTKNIALTTTDPNNPTANSTVSKALVQNKALKLQKPAETINKAAITSLDAESGTKIKGESKFTSKAQITKTHSNIETWASLVESLVEHNPNVQGAYQAYKHALAKAGLKIANIVLPDAISFRFISGETDPEKMSASKNPFSFKEKGQQVLAISKSLGINTWLAPQPASYAATAALAQYELAIIREITELLPSLLLLAQAEQLEKIYDSNIERLERSLKSVKARSDQAIGLLSESDLALAQAEYEAGRAEMIDMKEKLKLAKAAFTMRVGREPRGGLKDLVDIEFAGDVNIQQAPEVKAAFSSYRAARAGQVAATMDLISPTLTANLTNQHQSASSPQTRVVFEVGIGLDFRKAESMVDVSQQASSNLYRYKQAIKKLEYERNTYASEDNANKAQFNAINQSVTAAERYASAEQRKFESSFQDLRESSIISPELMLRAFKEAHGRNLSMLTAQRKLYDNRLKYVLEFGKLWSLKGVKNKITVHTPKTSN